MAERLALYHRESLEAGALFEAAPFAQRQGRAGRCSLPEGVACHDVPRGAVAVDLNAVQGIAGNEIAGAGAGAADGIVAGAETD